jgi:YHS domain-containing protein
MERRIKLKSATLVLLMIGAFLVAGNAAVLAEESAQPAKASSEVVQPVNVGNKICPVSGDKINEETKATYEYQGKIYNFCCPMCIDEFKKDPEKYIKKIEEEKQKEAATAQQGEGK